MAQSLFNSIPKPGNDVLAQLFARYVHGAGQQQQGNPSLQFAPNLGPISQPFVAPAPLLTGKPDRIAASVPIPPAPAAMIQLPDFNSMPVTETLTSSQGLPGDTPQGPPMDPPPRAPRGWQAPMANSMELGAMPDSMSRWIAAARAADGNPDVAKRTVADMLGNSAFGHDVGDIAASGQRLGNTIKGAGNSIWDYFRKPVDPNAAPDAPANAQGTPVVPEPPAPRPDVPTGGTPAPTAPGTAQEALLRAYGMTPGEAMPGFSRPGALSLPEPPKARMPDINYPSSPVPQMAQPSAFDRTKVDSWLDKAAPKPYEADHKEMVLAGLLGAAMGLGNAQPGMNLGQTFGKMVASAAPNVLQARQQEKTLERESQRDQRSYAGARANTEVGLENSRLAREDTGRQIDYTNAQALRQDLLNRNTFDLEKARLGNEIERGNYQLVFDRLDKIHSAGVQDAQLDILRQRAQAAMLAASLRGQGAGSQGALNPTGSSMVESAFVGPHIDAARAQLRVDKKMQAMELTHPKEFNEEVMKIARWNAFRSAPPADRAAVLRMLQAQKGAQMYSPAEGLDY